jgi:hypothetical protein
MTRHVDLLSVLFRLWGVLALVAGFAMLMLAIGALAIITSAERAALGPDFGAALTAGAFFVFAALALLWGGIHVLTGMALRRYRHRARLAGMALAVLNLFFLPFGTALAVYTFWTLLSDETRRLFDPARQAGS